MQQICTFLAHQKKTCFSTSKCNKFAPFWRVMRIPAIPFMNATNLHLFGTSRENLLFQVIMQQICTFLARHEKNLLFHLKMQQICTFLTRHEKTCNSIYECNKFAPFWRVTRKPAFPRNNATNLHVFWRVTRKPAFPRNNAANLHLFGTSRENLLFRLKMQQICTFLARHEKTCFSTYKCTKFATFLRVTRKPAFHVIMQQICIFYACYEKTCFSN